MAEISDDELATLRKGMKLMQDLVGNKETRREFEKLAKKVNPHAVTTDEQVEPYLEPVNKELKELREWKAQIEGNMSEYSKSQSIQSLRQAGYTEDGIKAIEKIMEDKGLKDYDVAAAYWDKVQPPKPVAPNGISPSMWNFQDELGDDEADAKLLMSNDDAWLDKKAAQIMNSLNGRGE